MTKPSSFNSSELPNPFTPMAFLSPELAQQKTMRIYVLVGVLGILVWDILAHLGADYKLLTRYRTNLPTLVYFFSRWTSLLYSITSVVFDTAQVKDCNALSKVACATYHPAISTTALLFFFRVRAIYGGNKWITAIFFAMWLAILGTSLTFITSLGGAHIGNTKYCMFIGFQPYRSLSNVTIGVFDTCVFVAISWRLLAWAPPVSDTGSSGRFGLYGKYLPQFSRVLLQDGQKYYLVAMICNLLVLIMTYGHGIPTVYRPLFLIPSVGLTNIMACRVFRNTKLRSNDVANATGVLNTILGQSKYTIPTFAQPQNQSTVYSINTHNLETSSVRETEAPSSGSSAEKLPELPKGVLAV
ncbi:hypothetical protein BDZ94DRAFT_1167276 [Collybia nuda]|uniref:Transmembrane protein n=1 Tax=Collybia nuda TaxID=64659 RepID=A0A9P5Y3N6_9AGAR|nr:hypothetical protein BDZ94DRAFT_1167276 [Collybia nuda]